MLPLLLMLDPDPSRLSLCIADQGFHKVAVGGWGLKTHMAKVLVSGAQLMRWGGQPLGSGFAWLAEGLANVVIHCNALLKRKSE